MYSILVSTGRHCSFNKRFVVSSVLRGCAQQEVFFFFTFTTSTYTFYFFTREGSNANCFVDESVGQTRLFFLAGRGCILLEIDNFFFFLYKHSLVFFVWCWVNSGSTLSSQAPSSFTPPPSFSTIAVQHTHTCTHTHTIWTVACLAHLCTTLWWLTTAGRKTTSRDRPLLSRDHGALGMD